MGVTPSLRVRPQVRPIERPDLPDLLGLCREHAAYEKADFHDDGQVERWEDALFGPDPVLHCWLARDGRVPCGFMSVTVDYATWDARTFAHMDCLFVREPYRGSGLGRVFLETLERFCVERGHRAAQWQTPPDNELGIGFYRAMGATERPKLRFTYAVEEAP
jgi:GNAT superfamily N-acetyltransferase